MSGMTTRSRKMITILQNLSLPKYESTKNSSTHDQTVAIRESQKLFEENLKDKHSDVDESEEDPFLDSGSEYIPSNSDTSSIVANTTDNEEYDWEINDILSANFPKNTQSKKNECNEFEKGFCYNEPKYKTSANLRNKLNETEKETMDMETDFEEARVSNAERIFKERVCRSETERTGVQVKETETENRTETETMGMETDFEKAREGNAERIFKERVCRSETVRREGIQVKETEEQMILIAESETKEDGKRLRNKMHSCCYCQKLLQNMARHYEILHHKEMDVARILAMPKNSKRRRDHFGILIRAGDFHHNCEVLSSKSGELILVRRPTPEEKIGLKYSDYGPCPHCLGFMLKRHLWHHVRGCLKAKEHADEDFHVKNIVIESTAIVNGIVAKKLPTNFLNNIVSKLRNDSAGSVCKDDDLILRFGAFLYDKYGDTQAELIRQSMRQLGRLVNYLKTLDENIKSLADCLFPQKFDGIVDATKQLCSVIEGGVVKRTEFQTPSLALKVGYALKKCIGIERGKALRTGNLKRDKELTSLNKLLKLEWEVRISSSALATLRNRKMNGTELLPLTGDLVKLGKFLAHEINETVDEIKKINSLSIWNKLASLTLARVVLFNKRRSGETARMTVNQYSSRPTWDESSCVQESLTHLEKQLAKQLVLVQIIGKRGRIVPVILTPDMKQSIDLLIEKRNHAGVLSLSQNPFLFALSNTPSSYIRGHDALKKWCLQANLDAPDLIAGTKLRKYVATVSQVFNLTENQTDWLARHLGHDIRVHREFYRLHENAVELAKVSRILMAVDKGNTAAFAGKRLDEINADDLPDVNETSDAECDDNENDKEVDYCESPVPDSSNQVEEEMILDTGKFKKQKSKASRNPWSSAESKVVLNAFRNKIKHSELPGKAECTKLMQDNPQLFSNRKWTDIKFFVKNHLTRVNRLKQKP